VRKKVFRGIGLLFLLAIGYAGWRFGPPLYDFWKGGYFDPIEMKKYQGTSMENLKNLYTAMMLYHESEEAFPPGDVWMDRIKPYIRTVDLAPEEAVKKFQNPLIRPAGPSVFGYAMNEACSAKYKDDVKGGDVPLIFDSGVTTWNAHGNPASLAPKPARPGGNLAVSLSGKVGPLKP
jgi:hypothetical protein